jgi:hypothetical protein
MYLETGEKKYKSAADRMWREFCQPDKNGWGYYSHGSRMAIWYSQINDTCENLWKKVVSGKSEHPKMKPWFRYLDSFGRLGDKSGNPQLAIRSMVLFDLLGRTGRKYTGQMHGVNPIFRGGTPLFTQMNIMAQRGAVYAARQVAKGRRLFPAGYFNGRVRQICVNDPDDEELRVHIGVPAFEKIVAYDPSGKTLPLELKQVVPDIYLGLRFTQPKKAVRLYTFTIPKDGKKGIYRIFKPGWHQLYYIGSSNNLVALLMPRGSLNFANCDPLFIRSKDFINSNSGETRFVLNGFPGNSFEIFSKTGRRLFSKTILRPAADAIGMAFKVKLPEGVCRLGDKSGIFFPKIKNAALYTNPNAIFKIQRPGSVKR